MLTIRSIEWSNWKCYGGLTHLELEPKAYAIVARMVGNEERSNWLGKSSVIEGIDYTLTGRLPLGARLIGDWVTVGCKEGGTAIECSDGSRIERSIVIGKSEQIRYRAPGASGAESARQDAAEKAIVDAHSLTPLDRLATSYFRQRDLARLVLCDPAERMRLISGWIRLEPLQACEAVARAVFGELVRRRDELTGKREEWKRALERLNGDGASDDDAIARAGLAVEGEMENVAICEADERRRAERDQLRVHSVRYEAIVGEGQNIGQRLKGQTHQALEVANKRASDELKTAGEQMALRRQEASAKNSLLGGRFDGMCPLAGAQCPSAQFVTGEQARNVRNAEQATAQLRVAQSAYEQASTQARTASEATRERDLLQARVDGLREEARRLKSSHERYKNLEVQVCEAAPAESARERLIAAKVAHERLIEARAKVRSYEEEIVKLTEELDRFETTVRTAGTAASIFRKAQQVVAETVLADIEGRACELLHGCGIELSVRIQWSREGSGLANACDECGEAYPKSERVKACPRCGAVRGMQMVNKLELIPSDRSGAADDFAGLAVQLAAASWLREERNSMWGVCMLDEPFGQLDSAHRKALSSHLPGMLASAGFAQAFVIAHHASVVDALPGRILVESDGKRATASVIR